MHTDTIKKNTIKMHSYIIITQLKKNVVNSVYDGMDWNQHFFFYAQNYSLRKILYIWIHLTWKYFWFR